MYVFQQYSSLAAIVIWLQEFYIFKPQSESSDADRATAMKVLPLG